MVIIAFNESHSILSPEILETHFTRVFDLWKSSMFKYGYVSVNDLLMFANAS